MRSEPAAPPRREDEDMVSGSSTAPQRARGAADQVVAVLSLSRSGSSLLARVLHEALGVDFGEPIEHIPANRNNTDGYYENAALLELNDRILRDVGATVFQPPPLDYYLSRASALGGHREEAGQVIAMYGANRPRFGLKDPRLSLTLPLWRSVVPGIVPIIIFRNPSAAALSIVDQAGIPVDQAM
ncbi:MAG TPA: hypothetical protein VFM29_00480, partial [Vicinamibacteria bacterium]|nr:hypothetical protein [Vicinamibacteria bacterium]